MLCRLPYQHETLELFRPPTMEIYSIPQRFTPSTVVSIHLKNIYFSCSHIKWFEHGFESVSERVIDINMKVFSGFGHILELKLHQCDSLGWQWCL